MSTLPPVAPGPVETGARKPRRRALLWTGAALLVVAALVVVIVVVTQSNGPVDVKSIPESAGWNSTSTNWSGYAETSAQTGERYTSISISWTVPAIAVTSSNTLSCSSQWAGIGGATSKDLIQMGTSGCTESGQIGYYAWYETLPAANSVISSLDIVPGDHVTATLQLLSGGSGSAAATEAADYQALVRLVDHYDPVFGSGNIIQRLRQLLAEGESHLASEPWFPKVAARLRSVFSEPAPSSAETWQFHFQVTAPSGAVHTFTKDVTYQSSMSSAEWITEAPTDQSGVEPLPDYGVAHFLGIAADGGSPTLVPADEILLNDPYGQASVPSSTSGQLDQFNTCYFPTFHVSSCPVP